MRNKKRTLIYLLVGLFLFWLSGVVDELRVFQGANASVYVIAIASIVLLTGYSGQLSLGHGALMAVGAYAAVLTQKHWHFSLLLTFISSVLAAACVGAILGIAAARLKGPYLAGTTLAFAVGLPTLANQFSIFGGEQGLNYEVGQPPKSLGADFTQYKWYFWITALAALIMMWVVHNLLTSRYGRQWRAIKSSQVSAALSGLNVARSKVLAFTISSGIAGLAGALLALTLNLVTPSAFPLSLSFAIVTGAVLAGLSSLPSSIIGALVLVAIPDLADFFATKLGGAEKVSANLPGLITSALLIVTILSGPLGSKLRLRRKKSLKVEGTI